ncbi:MAG: AraC family transcriptional regulator [Geminicoccus sp.]|nr:AraC family transcriptional regulator [Geminicoccus sp.]
MRVYQAHYALREELIRLLKDKGVSQDQLFADLSRRGISPLPPADGLRPIDEGLVALEAAVELSGDPCLMIRLGQRLGLASYGSFGFALMSCANVREAIRLLLRYGQVMFRPVWTVHEHEGGLLLRPGITIGTAKQQQLFSELIFSNLVTLGRELHGDTAERAQDVELHLRFSRPSYWARYRRAFSMPVAFECEHNQLFLPARVLDIPVKTANRAEHILFQQQCEEMLRGLRAVGKTTAAVRHVLIQSTGDFLDITRVARRLNLSERTLRRRLVAESVSFSSIVDEIKDLLAREYLAKTELKIAEIADLIGYAEPSSFRRAFVRWNGMTPIDYRQQHMTENTPQGAYA